MEWKDNGGRPLKSSNPGSGPYSTGDCGGALYLSRVLASKTGSLQWCGEGSTQEQESSIQGCRLRVSLPIQSLLGKWKVPLGQRNCIQSLSYLSFRLLRHALCEPLPPLFFLHQARLSLTFHTSQCSLRCHQVPLQPSSAARCLCCTVTMSASFIIKPPGSDPVLPLSSWCLGISNLASPSGLKFLICKIGKITVTHRVGKKCVNACKV